MLLAAAVAALLAVQASAHVCMWHPMQRDGMSIAGPAENPCYRKVGPCGTDKVGPVTQLPAGRTYTVEFQQNANHCAYRRMWWGVRTCAAPIATDCERTLTPHPRHFAPQTTRASQGSW